MSMSQLIALSETQNGTLVRYNQQPIWQDPETDYILRHVSQEKIPLDLVSIALPPGVTVPMSSIACLCRRQLIRVLDGSLTIQEGSMVLEMHKRECLELGDPADCVFVNHTSSPCHYAVVVLKSS